MLVNIDTEEYLPLVKSIARNYRNYGVPYEDLVQEGFCGLIEAVSHFNPGENTKFSTYATYWIKKKIIVVLNRECREQSVTANNFDVEESPDTLQAPASPGQDEHFPFSERSKLYQTLPNVEKQIVELSVEDGKSLKQISRVLGIRRERVRQLKKKAMRRIKLHDNLT